MKNISKVTIILIAIYLMAMGYTVTRIRDLADTQSTYADSLLAIVDFPGFSNHKKMYLIDIAPKIDNETSGGTSVVDGSTTYMRINDGAGNEFKILTQYVAPRPNDLSTAPGTSSWNMLYQNPASSTPSKITISSLTGIVTGVAGFTTAVNNRITAVVTESFILNLVQTDTSFMVHEGITDYGTLYLTKIGNQVTGIWDNNGTLSGNLVHDEGNLGTFTPGYDVNCINASRVDNEHTYLFINSDGTLGFDVNNNDNSGVPVAYTLQ